MVTVHVYRAECYIDAGYGDPVKAGARPANSWNPNNAFAYPSADSSATTPWRSDSVRRS